MPASDNLPEKLRGELPSSEPGARGLEYMARNPACKRLVALTVATVAPSSISEQVYGVTVSEGLSPFAIRRGERFEEALFADKGKRLFEMYARAGRLGPQERSFLDLSTRYPGSSSKDLKARNAASVKMVSRRLAGEAGLPNILVKPRLSINLMGHEFACEPDALVAGDSDLHWRVVEIKSYADRWSRTDTVKTGSACRQAAVGFLALGQASGVELEQVADLVFARPGTNWPTLNPMDISAEVTSLQRAIAEAPEVAVEALRDLDGLSLSDKAGLESISNNPCSGCSDHCALWEGCFTGIATTGHPAVLGDSAREILTGINALEEAIRLRDEGADDNPDRDVLAGLLANAQAEYQAGLTEL